MYVGGGTASFIEFSKVLLFDSAGYANCSRFPSRDSHNGRMIHLETNHRILLLPDIMQLCQSCVKCFYTYKFQLLFGSAVL